MHLTDRDIKRYTTKQQDFQYKLAKQLSDLTGHSYSSLMKYTIDQLQEAIEAAKAGETIYKN